VQSPHQPVDEATIQVLFVDDDLDARRHARALLGAAGFHVVTAESGISALSLVEWLGVDVVVTDIIMPEADGIELIQNLRRRRPALPIVAITGGGAHRDMEALRVAAALGAGAVLEKPFRSDALVAAIRRVLEAATGPRP
jgi:DNA-binding NtrC family response regulator